MTVALVLGAAVAAVAPANRTAVNQPASAMMGSRTIVGPQGRQVVQPVPLFVGTGKRFARLRSALAYCEDGGCSTPSQLEALYDMNPLSQEGETGKGVTIAIVDSFGSPTIARDLDYFDRGHEHPESAEVQDHPAGRQGACVQPSE